MTEKGSVDYNATKYGYFATMTWWKSSVQI